MGGNEMKHDEFKKLCRKPWKEDFSYLFTDRTEKREEGRDCICNENKNSNIEFRPETKHLGTYGKLKVVRKKKKKTYKI